MKILFHIHCLGKGGAERVLTILASCFAKEGNEIIIATEEYAIEEYQIPNEIKRVDVGVINTRMNPVSRYMAIRKRIRKLRNCIRTEEPDLVIAFERNCNYRALQAVKGVKIKGRNVPVIVSVRNDPKRNYTGRNLFFSRRNMLNAAAGCVFQTKGAQSFFPQELQERSIVIWNPINEKYLETQYCSSKELYFVNVGRMAPQKNQALLIRAFVHVHRMYPEYKLRIYGGDTGDGTSQQLAALVKECGLEHNVQFMGISDKLEEEVPRACGFVLSSDYEGMPNVVMEALAMGVPVISTDCPCGGPASLIEDGINGRLVPVGDEEALAEAMLELIADPERAQRLGIKAMEIRKKANIETIYGQWKTYIAHVLCIHKEKQDGRKE